MLGAKADFKKKTSAQSVVHFLRNTAFLFEFEPQVFDGIKTLAQNQMLMVCCQVLVVLHGGLWRGALQMRNKKRFW